MCVPVSHRRKDKGWIYTQVFDAKTFFFFFCQTLSISREIPLIKNNIFFSSPFLHCQLRSELNLPGLFHPSCSFCSFDRSCLPLRPHRLQQARFLFLIYRNLTFCSCYGLNYDPSNKTEFGSMTFKNIIKVQRCHKAGALMHYELFLCKKRER